MQIFLQTQHIHQYNIYKNNISDTRQIKLKNENEYTINTVLGFPVDKDGYFTDKLNKVAGIPSDYKIHSDTIKSLVKVKTSKDTLSSFKAIDIAKTLNNAYKILRQVVGDELLNKKDSFSSEDISKFPTGYTYNKNTLQVNKIFNTPIKYVSSEVDFSNRADKNEKMTTTFHNSSVMNFYENPKGLTTTKDALNSNSGGKEMSKSGIYFDTTKDKYTNSDGFTTKGGLLIGIIANNLDVTEGELTHIGFLNGYDKNISSKEYQMQTFFFSLNRNPKNISKDDYEALPEHLKAYVDFSSKTQRITNGIFMDDGSQEKPTKNPLELMLEAMNKDMKESLKRLAKKAEMARLEQKRALQVKTNINDMKDINLNLIQSLNDVVDF